MRYSCWLFCLWFFFGFGCSDIPHGFPDEIECISCKKSTSCDSTSCKHCGYSTGHSMAVYQNKKLKIDFPEFHKDPKKYGDKRTLWKIRTAKIEQVKDLSLRYNQIFDISPLKSLTKLESLSLNQNEVSDISVLKNLKNLEELDLAKNKISDVSPLKNLKKLRVLYLSDNKITDLSPLGDLSELRELYLHGNYNGHGIKNISALSNLKKLEKLTISGYSIEDFSPLFELSNLEYLSCFLPSKNNQELEDQITNALPDTKVRFSPRDP